MIVVAILILAAAVGVVAFWRPVFGAACVIILWPAYLIRLNLLGIPTTALELSLYAAVAGTGLAILTRRLPWHWVRMTRLSWWLLALWVAAWILAVGFSADQRAALGAWKAWLVDPLLFTALVAVVVQSPTHRHWIIRVLMISGTIVALAGLAQMVWFRSTLQDGRLSSFFQPVANYAAMFLVPIAVLTASLLISRTINRRWWPAVAAMLLAAVLTVSFGGYAALAIAGLFIWFNQPSSRMKRGVLIGAVVAAAVIVPFLTQTRYYHEHFNRDDRSSSLVRYQIWATSWQLIRQHPVVGIGPNVFEPAYRREAPKLFHPPLEWLVAQPHNLYLALWLETGLVGLVIFLVLVVYHFRLAWQEFVPRQSERAIALASLAALIAILVHGLVDTPYFKNDLAIEFMILAVLPWLGQPRRDTN